MPWRVLRGSPETAVPASPLPPVSRFGLSWVPLLSLAVAALLWSSPLQQRLGNALHDIGVRMLAEPARFDDVVLVDIDDASLRSLRPQLGGWPYSRDSFALLIDYLRELGARRIVLNLVLSEPREGDSLLARSLGGRGDVVLAAVGQPRDDGGSRQDDPLRRRVALAVDAAAPGASWAGVVMPADELLNAQARAAGPGSIGVVSAQLDADGYLRRMALLHRADGLIYPSMVLAPYLLSGRAADPAHAPALQAHPGSLQVAERNWPTDGAGFATVLLPANSDAVPRVAFGELMSAAIGLRDGSDLAPMLSGRTVFIGSSAFLSDEVMTPLGRMSGSTVLASAHAALGRGWLLKPPRAWMTGLLCALALTPAVALWLRRRPMLRRDGPASLVVLALIAAIALTTLVLGRTEVEPLLPLTIVLIGLISAAVLQLRWDTVAHRQLSVERAMAEAANHAKSEFLANVSHEIRTPMNALLGVAELLQRTPLNFEQQRYVAVFRRSGQTLFELINDLLDLSKIEAGRLELDPRAFSLRSLLEEQHELLRIKAVDKGLTLEWRTAERLPDAVRGDRRRLAQVLTNLVGNAIKFTDEGRVSVTVAPDEGGVRFEISDTGIGIDPAQQQRIFQPFTQADSSATRVHGGTGLGLSIASKLVDKMGGQITLSSQPGAGASFSFTIALPVAPSEEARLEESEAIAPPATPAAAAADRLPGPLQTAADQDDDAPFRILLTEDNEVNVLMVEAMLAGSGCSLDVANNGEAALARFRAEHYDLILMDVQMPGIDGHQATREIRRMEAAERRRPVPVVALTAHAFERDVQRSLEAGCNAHLTKPVSREDLLATISAFRTADR